MWEVETHKTELKNIMETGLRCCGALAFSFFSVFSGGVSQLVRLGADKHAPPHTGTQEGTEDSTGKRGFKKPCWFIHGPLLTLPLALVAGTGRVCKGHLHKLGRSLPEAIGRLVLWRLFAHEVRHFGSSHTDTLPLKTTTAISRPYEEDTSNVSRQHASFKVAHWADVRRVMSMVIGRWSWKRCHVKSCHAGRVSCHERRVSCRIMSDHGCAHLVTSSPPACSSPASSSDRTVWTTECCRGNLHEMPPSHPPTPAVHHPCSFNLLT